jgi:hypothetical protein
MKGKDALAYVLYNMGCIHPFILSRIVALAELAYLKEKKKRLTDLKYSGVQAAFYIENLNKIIDEDNCFKKHEGDPAKKIMGCIEYICELKNLDENTKYLDDAIDKAYDLTENELNDMVIKDEHYRELIS